jgi:hypothetical protein
VIWIPIAAWAAAVVVALVVLGFAGYEIWWKVARVRGDLHRLLALGDTLRGLQSELTAVQERLSRSGLR